MKRVYLRHQPNEHVFFVMYFDRQKHGRYSAAQFDDRLRDSAYVQSWIRANPKLQFVCAISGKPI